MENIGLILDELNIEYKYEQDNYFFTVNQICYRVDSTGNIYISDEYFGFVPHIMPDGRVCVAGNQDINFIESDKNILSQTILTYVPWLISLRPELKVAEMLSEIDFYIKVMRMVPCETSFYLPDNCLEYNILNPLDLWDCLSSIDHDKWYKLSPSTLPQYYVYLMKSNCGGFIVSYDDAHKARQRVSGLSISYSCNPIVFIGVGSVNSYIIKFLMAKGHTNFILIDDDTVEVGNLLRFAFPLVGIKKVDAVEFYSGMLDKRIQITKIDARIHEQSADYLSNVNEVYVSVDNFVSWLIIFKYILEHSHENLKVNFVGVDAFGGYGKFVKTKLSGGSSKKFNPTIANFLFYKDKHKGRSSMVGNGCGNSLSIYCEEDLVILAREVVTSSVVDEVVQVSFKN